MLALVVAMELRERLAVLRLASAFGTHGAGLCRLTFGPLMQAAYLAGRDRGRWEVGAAHLPEAERHSRKVVTADPGSRPGSERGGRVRVALGTDQIAKVVREAAGGGARGRGADQVGGVRAVLPGHDGDGAADGDAGVGADGRRPSGSSEAGMS